MGRSPRNSIRLAGTGSSYAINSSQCSLSVAGAALGSAVGSRPRSHSMDRQDSGGGTDMYERVSLLGNGEANDQIDETCVP